MPSEADVVAVLEIALCAYNSFVCLGGRDLYGGRPGCTVVQRGLHPQIGLQPARVIDCVVVDHDQGAGDLIDRQTGEELIVLCVLVVELYWIRPGRATIR